MMLRRKKVIRARVAKRMKPSGESQLGGWLVVLGV